MSRVNKNKNEMTMGEHFQEFKKRVFTSVVIYILLFVIMYLNCNKILDFLINTGNEAGYNLVYITPQEVLSTQIKISGIIALMASLPVILVEIASFIAPAIETKFAKLKMIALGALAIVLFVLGLLFAFYILLPFLYTFLYGLGVESNITAQVSLEKYISLFMTVAISLGMVTEMPLLCIILTKIGLLNKAIMVRFRSFVIILIFIVAAIITPPDIVSQVMVGIPMVLLYEISIFVCGFIKKDSK